MASSWRVSIDAVKNLQYTDLNRLGDFTKKVGANLQNFFSKRDSDPPNPDIQGRIAVEVQVGSFVKRTAVFIVHGTEIEVEVNQILMVPIPSQGQSMSLRVLRVHTLEQDALIGQTEIKSVIETPTDVDILRDDKVQGIVHLTVLEDVANLSKLIDEGETASLGYRFGNITKNLRNQVLAGQEGQGLIGFATQRVLGKRATDLSPIGACVVVIEGVKGLMPKLQEPVIIVNVEGQEFRAQNLTQRSAGELTFKFAFSKPQSTIRIYCYDDLAVNRNSAAGRILIPLSDLFSDVGDSPSLSMIIDAFARQRTRKRQYVLQFMPIVGNRNHADGFWDPHANDCFMPAFKKQQGSGLDRSLVFGSITVRVEATLDRSLVETYVASTVKSAHVILTGEEDVASVEEMDHKQSLINVLQNFDVVKVQNNIARFEMFLDTPCKGLIRWLRSEPWHRVVVCFVWCLGCFFDFFPPPLWASPLLIWALYVVNGLVAAAQRKDDWGVRGSQRQVAFGAWQSKKSVEEAAQNIKQGIKDFKKTMRQLEWVTGTVVSFLERSSNLFSCVDGTGSILSVMASGVIGLVCTILLYLGPVVWKYLDPSAAWSARTMYGLVGVAIILGVSQPKSEKDDQAELRFMSQFNKVLSCVPDDEEMAHVHIATRIQCTSSRAVENLVPY